MFGSKFAAPAAEWRFRRHFMANSVYIDLGLAFLAMILPALSSLFHHPVITAAATGVASTAAAEAAGVVEGSAAGPSTGAAAGRGVCWQGSLDHCAAWMLITLLLVATVKLDGYIKLTGVLCTIQRLQVALGLSVTSCPSCALWCPMLWRHRLLVLHMASTLARVPARLLLLGGLPVWLLATLTDVLNLPEACGQSVSCYYHALQMLLAQAVVGGPLSTLQHIMRALCSSSSVTHLVGVLGPSLLATYREVQARKAWAAQEEKNSASMTTISNNNNNPSYEAESHIDQQPEPNQHPSAGQTSTAAVLGLSSKQQLQQLQLQDPQCPGTPAVTAPAQKPVSARGRAAAPPAAMKRNPAPAASVSPRIQQRLNNGRPWYVSPAVSKLVQFSLQQPPDASAEEYDAVKQQLKAAVVSHYSSASSAHSSISSSTGSSSVHSCQIAECTTFRGSWNLVIRAVLARRVSLMGTTRAQQQQQQLEQQLQLMQLPQPLPDEVDVDQRQLQQLAQQVLQSWTGWTLLDVGRPSPGAAGAAVGRADLSSSAVYVTAALDPGWFLHPAAIPLPAVNFDRSCYEASSSSSASGSSKWASASSSGSRTSDMPSYNVDLCVSAAVVQRLLQAGSRALRVIIAQQPQGHVLLDESWALLAGNEQQPAAGTAAPDGGGGGGGSGSDVRPVEVVAAAAEIPLPQLSEQATGLLAASLEAATAAAAAQPAARLSTSVSADALGDLQVQLHVSWLDDRAMQQQQQQHAEGPQQQQDGQAGLCTGAQVLSVLILTDSSLATESAGAAAATPIPTPPEAPQANAPRANCIVAQLPLLVLPALAQAELQGLVDAAVAGGMAESLAYQQILPVLQDWAVLMLWSDGSSSGASATNSGRGDGSNSSSVSVGGSDIDSTTGSRGRAGTDSSGQLRRRRLLVLLHEELTGAVSAFCDEFELSECYRLLSLQQWQRQHASVSVWQASTVEEELDQVLVGSLGTASTATASNLAEFQGVSGSPATAVHREALGMQHPQSLVAAGRSRFAAVASAPAASSTAAVLNGSHHSSKSSPGFSSLGYGSTLNGSSTRLSNTASSKSSTLSHKLSAAAAELSQQQQLDPAAYINVRTLAFGFPEIAVERAYAVYKAALLYRQDGVAAVLHAAVAAAAFGQILWQLTDLPQALTGKGLPLQQQQQQLMVVVGVLKVVLLATFAAAQSLTWLATWCHFKHRQQRARGAGVWQKVMAAVGRLVYCRELLMVLAPGVGLMMVYGCMYQGGQLAAALQQLVRNSPQFQLFLVGYVALAQPLISAARLPVTAANSVTLVLLQSKLPDSGFVPGVLSPWLEQQGAVGVVAMVALTVAGLQEARMQGKFIRAVQGAT